MLGLKHMPTSRLSTALTVLSIAMMVFGTALVPESSSIMGLAIWAIGALVLLGLWISVIAEIGRRFFGSGSSDEGE